MLVACLVVEKIQHWMFTFADPLWPCIKVKGHRNEHERIACHAYVYRRAKFGCHSLNTVRDIVIIIQVKHLSILRHSCDLEWRARSSDWKQDYLDLHARARAHTHTHTHTHTLTHPHPHTHTHTRALHVVLSQSNKTETERSIKKKNQKKSLQNFSSLTTLIKKRRPSVQLTITDSVSRTTLQGGRGYGAPFVK